MVNPGEMADKSLPRRNVDIMLERIKSALTRETSGGSLIPHVDGLRFFAVVSVLLFHLNGYVAQKVSRPILGDVATVGADALVHDPVWRVLSSGYFGVQLFFAISGFILGMPFAKAWFQKTPQPQLGKYFWRRVTRLEPPYVICMCVMAGLLVVMKHEPVGEVLKHLAASLGYAHYFIYGTESTINGVAWSLEIEVQFYLLAPLLATVFAIPVTWLRRMVLIGAIAGFAFVQRYTQSDTEHGFTLLHEAHYFLCGFLLADFQCNEWSRGGPSRNESMIWDIAGLAAWVLMVVTLARWTPLFERPGMAGLYPLHQELPHLPLAGLLVVAYCAAFRGKFWKALLSKPFLYIIGGMCYTIYLWHFLIVSVAGRFALPFAHSQSHAVNVLICSAIIIPPVIMISAVLFALFEKPFMRKDWVQRAWGRVSGRSARPAAE